jgi:signal recognition particle receptor subunit beta
MGGAMAYYSNPNSPKTELSFLLIGPENSGKTTALLNLVYPGDNIIAVPTLDFNSDVFYYKQYTINLLDMTKNEWYKQREEDIVDLFKERDALLFFVDCTKIREKPYQNSVKKLFDSFIHLNLSKNFPFLVVVNKQDLNAEVDTEEVVNLLDLYRLKDRKWYIKAVSAILGNGLNECIEWLLHSLEK